MDLQERYLVYSRSVVPIVCSSTLWLSCGTVTSPFGGPGSILYSFDGPAHFSFSHVFCTHTHILCRIPRTAQITDCLLQQSSAEPSAGSYHLPRSPTHTHARIHIWTTSHTHASSLTHTHTLVYRCICDVCLCLHKYTYLPCFSPLPTHTDACQ